MPTAPKTIAGTVISKSAVSSKTIQLLPNCIAKEKANKEGAYEAIMIMGDGTVSEGSSSNVWLVKLWRLIKSSRST